MRTANYQIGRIFHCGFIPLPIFKFSHWICDDALLALNVSESMFPNVGKLMEFNRLQTVAAFEGACRDAILYLSYIGQDDGLKGCMGKCAPVEFCDVSMERVCIHDVACVINHIDSLELRAATNRWYIING